MAIPKSRSDLRSAVHDLGGDDKDYDLVADVGDSGSEFEEEGSSINTGKLEDDVATMWAELSKDDKDSKNKVAQGNGKTAEKTKQPIGPSDTSSKIKKRAEQLQEGVRKEGGASSNVKQPNNQNLSKLDSKTKSHTSPAPQPISKKLRKEWDDYLVTVEHPNNALLVNEESWYSLTGEADVEADRLPADIAISLKERARKLLEVENALYFKQRSQDRDFSGSLEFLKSGTFSDQLGTLSILATESPLHSVRFLSTLVSKCDIKNRESACKALEVAKDLLVSHVLPDRRLQWFKDQSIKIGATQQQLVAWSFEDFLKELFFKLLQVMERLLSDTVESIRLRTLHCVFDFFRLKPEQEANLLRLGLNKLGDPSGKLASRVKKLVMDALQVHPGMKSIVASVTVEVLARNADYRTRYYAVDMLSEFVFSSREPALANQLIHIYLDLFERLITESQDKSDEKVDKPPTPGKSKNGKRFRAKRGKKGGFRQTKQDASETEGQQYARLVSKLFTGLNRAFPFSQLDPNFFGKYTDTLYHMSHSPNVGTFIEALSFIFQLTKATKKTGGDGRFFRTLYESLLDQRLPHSSKLGKYVHLLLKSVAELRSEAEVPRANALAKRMLQAACNWSEIGGAASLIHAVNHTPHTDRLLLESQRPSSEYDPRQRDPQYAKAETSQAWEILLLRSHFHPTVSLYASNILVAEGEKESLDLPDIEQYTVNSFLSKWSYKKPKARDTARGSSIFQPLSGFTDLTLGISQEQGPKSADPIQLQDWKGRKSSEIAPDEQFLYNYFSQLPEKPKPVEKFVKRTGDSEDDSESMDEDEISNAMARAGPGDMGGLEAGASDLDEDDSDLEDDDLVGAFSDSDDDDEDDSEHDEAFAEREQGGVPEQDDFVDFDDFDEQPSVAQEADAEDGSPKKRKRKWNAMPTFLDADAFEDFYAQEEANKEAAPKKRR